MTERDLGTLGNRIHSAMDAAGIKNQFRLSKLANVNNGNLSRLISGERGGHMSDDVARKLADALNVSQTWLVTGAGPRERPASATDISPSTLTIGEFLLKIGDDSEHSITGLKAEIKRCGAWRLSTIIKAASTPLDCGEDGLPKGGWPNLLKELEVDTTKRPHRGAGPAVDAAKKQVGKRRPPPKGMK